jgi:predicted nuclease of predicted toxin-antitoxin system
MRVLANENLPGPVIITFRERGHDVVAVKEIMPGADDRAVLRLAHEERRLVVTFDKGFGELAFRCRTPSRST